MVIEIQYKCIWVINLKYNLDIRIIQNYGISAIDVQDNHYHMKSNLT